MKRKKLISSLPLMLQLSILMSLESGDARAKSLDLSNTMRRNLTVAFEVSPREAPAQINTTYTRELPASLEPGERDGEVRVVIAGEIVERFLFGNQSPVPGSFSDFVWNFDVETGHVLSATMRGRVLRKLDWGIAKSQASAEIQVDMSTARVAGFRNPRRILGQLFFRHCDAPKKQCTLVEASPLDPKTGHVNAVGGMRVHSYVMNLMSFSPLGEAVFLEVDATLEGPGRSGRRRPP
jgi:hypothetical protein